MNLRALYGVGFTVFALVVALSVLVDLGVLLRGDDADETLELWAVVVEASELSRVEWRRRAEELKGRALRIVGRIDEIGVLYMRVVDPAAEGEFWINSTRANRRQVGGESAVDFTAEIRRVRRNGRGVLVDLSARR